MGLCETRSKNVVQAQTLNDGCQLSAWVDFQQGCQENFSVCSFCALMIPIDRQVIRRSSRNGGESWVREWKGNSKSLVILQSVAYINNHCDEASERKG